MDSGDCETEEDSAPEQCVSPEGGAILPSNSREMRNRAEKMRRDKLNSYITELATLVPMVSASPKRLDKTSVLRLTATQLRIYQIFSNGKVNPRMELPKQVDQCILDQLICEQLNGFLLILTPNGKIVFVSQTVENLLGHLQTDLMGQSIFNITAPDDHERLRLYTNSDGLVESDWKNFFNVRLKRAGPRTESPVYEPVSISGVHRSYTNDYNQNTSSGSSTCSTSSEISSTNSINNNFLLFFVRVVRPEPLRERLVEATKDEYVTRHLIDGRIINCDQRISLIAGYMTEEVSGLSAFRFMHRDDVRWVMIALRQMYDRNESKGTSCYRLLSSNGQFIYLRTYGFLEIDDQGTVESFVCVNTLVSESEGLQLIKQMKKRFSALINSHASPSPPCIVSDSSIQTVEDPQEVDASIVHLIRDLPSPSVASDHRSTPSSRIITDTNIESQDCCNTTLQNVNNSMTDLNNGGKVKKPYQIKLKTGKRRSISLHEDVIETTVYKRQKTIQQLTGFRKDEPTPFKSRAKITELTSPQPSDQSIYHQELQNNV